MATGAGSTTTAGKKIVLFDVDGTLTAARKVSANYLRRPRELPLRFPRPTAPVPLTIALLQPATADMLAFLKALRSRVHIGMVGGSDLVKQKEQLGEGGAFIAARMSQKAVILVR
jgi:FMN phosphatase YigB (HAD superfamily)